MGKVVNAHAAAIGRLGGIATRNKLTPERRSELASNAGRAAWNKFTKKERSDIMRKRLRNAKRRAEKAAV